MSENVPQREVRDELRTSAAPEDVYAAWADPARLAQWFVDRARGEARAGATMIWTWDAFGMDVPYEVVAADPGRRLVLRTPAHVAPPGVIEITIRRDAGETVLTLVNSGFLEGGEWDELFDGVRSGWTLTLALLKEYLERYHGRAKRTFVHMRPSPLEIEALQMWFTDESHLRRWLTTSGAPRPAPAVFPLVLRDGTTVLARVIAHTARELMLSLPGEEAVLELKAFSVPAQPQRDGSDAAPLLNATAALQRIVCLRGTSWAPDESRFDWLREICLHALDDLVLHQPPAS